MKKIKFLLMLSALVLAFGAQAYQKTVNEYVFDAGTNTIVPLEMPGHCAETNLEVYCKYTLKDGQPDDGDPAHYDPATSPIERIWVSDAR